MLKTDYQPDRDHMDGTCETPVIIVQYGDFLCPDCAASYAELKQLRRTLKDNLTFIYRHFPRPLYHPLAMDAALLSEAAATQGMFWEVYDLLFEKQGELTRDYINDLAGAAGINFQQFLRPKIAEHLLRKITSDFESGLRSGVTTTPSLFINKKKYNGPQVFTQMLVTCRYAALPPENDLKYK